MANKSYSSEFFKGIIKENPLLVLTLGTCPALAVTTSASNGLGMGLAATVVLLMSNLVISALRKVIPNSVRIPAFITIIASLVTVLQFLLEAYVPALNQSLGIFIPLITVNCIILGRAEAFANKNGLFRSLLDALGMGAGFTLALFVMGTLREILGYGTFFSLPLPWISEDGLQPIAIFGLPAGGFAIYGVIVAIVQRLKRIWYARKPAETMDRKHYPGSISKRTDKIFESSEKTGFKEKQAPPRHAVPETMTDKKEEANS